MRWQGVRLGPVLVYTLVYAQYCILDCYCSCGVMLLVCAAWPVRCMHMHAGGGVLGDVLASPGNIRVFTLKLALLSHSFLLALLLLFLDLQKA